MFLLFGMFMHSLSSKWFRLYLKLSNSKVNQCVRAYVSVFLVSLETRKCVFDHGIFLSNTALCIMYFQALPVQYFDDHQCLEEM